jgi:ABC-type arginine/histidine transport system permease subunit
MYILNLVIILCILYNNVVTAIRYIHTYYVSTPLMLQLWVMFPGNVQTMCPDAAHFNNIPDHPVQAVCQTLTLQYVTLPY